MLLNTKEYFETLDSIKTQIRDAQYRAILGLNREQILLFWNIGNTIIKNKKHGNAFVKNLACDIKSEFPQVKGFSVRNLRYMRRFAEVFHDIANLQVPLADLTWYHIITLLDKVADKTAYTWYAAKIIEMGGQGMF
jgi:predicted nuclease of restriction endonuclease-like (RecB) superfamily